MVGNPGRDTGILLFGGLILINNHLRMVVDGIPKKILGLIRGIMSILVFPLAYLMHQLPSKVLWILYYISSWGSLFWFSLMISWYTVSVYKVIYNTYNWYLKKWWRHQLFANRSKCFFGVQRIEYLGHFITTEDVSKDPRKIIFIQNWPIPTAL